MSGYCKIAPGHITHESYHDTEYGFPVRDENKLLERMAMEIMQAGLSWETILKKRDGLNAAFDKFNVDKVAKYGARDIARLMADKAIIRNRLKILAIIENANRFIELRDSHGGMAGWIKSHHPQSKESWVKIFKKQFKFMGGEIVGEFLMSIGYLPGAHSKNCPIFTKILQKKPAWNKIKTLR